MKRIIAVICILPFLFVCAAAASFSDVAALAWYYESVNYAAENCIVDGRGDETFDPDGTLSIAEAVKLAAVVHANQNGNELPQQNGPQWYDVYFDYAQKHGLITERENTDEPVTRAQFARYIFLAVGDLPERNSVADGEIRDVDGEYADAVYALYRSGILAGSDKYGRFFPDRSLTRAEACEIIMRIFVPSARKYTNLSGELNAADIFELCSGAVFSIETFNAKGETVRTGSGFFISSGGLAATNLHVLQYAHSAKVTTASGHVYDVLGVAAYSANTNAAILQINGDGLEWLPVTSSDDAKVGQDVYSIGTPLGLDGTISKGIISYVGRENAGRVFLQFTASISQGSGGGALVDSAGYVIGITSSSFTAGSSLNLATPSKHILELMTDARAPDELTALIDIIHADSY